jgi:hypothetical protein
MPNEGLQESTTATATLDTLRFRDDQDEGDGLRMDLSRLVESRLLVQANSGAGKSRALRSLLEETHGRVQQLVLDPEGEFASLREQFDYVLAGRERDVPAEPRSAGLLCRRLLELGASAVIDLYDLRLPDRRRFVRLFLEELMALPRDLWRPLLVVIDEAHVFVPERGEAESTEAVITLCTQGRKRGYAAVLATQRLSKLHKDAAAELLNKLIGRTSLDVDVRRAGDELGLPREERQWLKSLRPGEFYCYGPALAVQTGIVKIRTGEVLTSHPEAGRVGGYAAPPAPAAVQALLAQLADLPREAEEEARTVDELQRQLREARRQMQERQPAPKTVIQRVEVPVLDDVHVGRLSAAVDTLGVIAAQITAGLARLGPGSTEAKAVELGEPGKPDCADASPETEPPAAPKPFDPYGQAVERSEPAVAPENGARLPLDTAAAGLLAVLTRQYPARFSRAQLRPLLGPAANEIALRVALRVLAARGLVDSADTPKLTELGRVAVESAPKGRGAERRFVEWQRALPKAAWKLFWASVCSYPLWLARDELATLAGYQPGTGTMDQSFAALIRNELVDVRRGDGRNREVRAAASLIEEREEGENP